MIPFLIHFKKINSLGKMEINLEHLDIKLIPILNLNC